MDVLDNYDSDDVISILKDKKIKEEFKDGEHFNFSVDADDNTLLTKFFDIIPTKENQKDYNNILDSMKDMKKSISIRKTASGFLYWKKFLMLRTEKRLIWLGILNLNTLRNWTLRMKIFQTKILNLVSKT